MVTTSLASAAQVRRFDTSGEGVVMSVSQPTVGIDLLWPETDAGAGAARVELTFHWSQLLDTKTSSVDLIFDGIPVATLRLADAQPGVKQSFALPHRDKGVRRLELRARLRAADDECELDLADGMWLHVSGESRVIVPEGGEFSPVAEFVTAARAAREVWLRPQPEGLGRPEYAKAVLRADRLIRGWGATPRYAGDQTTLAASELELQLHTQMDAPVQSDAVVAGYAELRRAKLGSSLERKGGVLRIDALADEGLSLALRLLQDERALALCAGSKCLVPERAGEGPSKPAEVIAEDPFVAFELDDLGLSQGWLARGVGRQQLEFVWINERVGKIDSWPELRVPIRLGGLAALDRSASQLVVYLNDQPLQSWSLDRFDEEKQFMLTTRIPREVWRDPAWKLRVEVRFAASDMDDCRPRNWDLAWLKVGTGFQLRVPFERGEATVEPRPRLLWRGPLSLSDVAALAAALGVSADAVDELQWVSYPAACEHWCLSAGGEKTSGSGSGSVGMELQTVDGELRWRDQRARVPLIRAANTVLAFPEVLDGVAVWTLLTPQGLESGLDDVELSKESRSPWLWVEGHWRRIGTSDRDRERLERAVEASKAAPESTVTTPEPPNNGPTPSDEAERLARLDRLWSVLLGISLVALAVVFWRRGRRLRVGRSGSKT